MQYIQAFIVSLALALFRVWLFCLAVNWVLPAYGLPGLTFMNAWAVLIAASLLRNYCKADSGPI